MIKIKTILNKVLSFVISMLLVVMTTLVLWQVFTRYILNNPSTFTEELVIIILIWTSFLGTAFAFGTRQHMALIFLKEKLHGKKRIMLEVFIDLLVLLFAVIILIFGGKAITEGVFSVKTPILGISRGLIYISTVVSGVIITFYQLVNILEDLKIRDNLEKID
ncbi:TRAP transporter small permease [Cellulosilyticum sp. I15G10I2]|uniref:TRAP transporter small permease n=1 Tax=Cellulosilyticum sp. I15G10I2 TaxID=1892843 RepID=UPI00085BCAD0|nr:TRAP transporter small permease [Cellulosilyticum sp. I15G10I2]